MIIGILGSDYKGREVVAETLQEMNFFHFSLSEMLLTHVLEKVRDGENYVFTHLKPEHISILKRREDFVLLDVTRGKPSRLADVALLGGHEERLRSKVHHFVQDWLYKKQDSRPDWDHYFMNIAEQVKMRCNCLSAKKGAIIVKDKMIIATGYNGSPKGIKHCNEGGCPRCTARHLGQIKSGVYSKPCICAHSEENAIVQAAYNGTSTKGATMYTTFTPCTNCAKLIINAGIRQVICKTVYPDDVGTKLLHDAGVKLRVLK